jgi:hypothetical protein
LRAQREQDEFERIEAVQVTESIDAFEQGMRDLLVAEHERQIAEAQRRADEAAACGEEWYRKWHQDQVDRMRAIVFPWEKGPDSAGDRQP